MVLWNTEMARQIRGKGMKDVFLKKLVGKQASVHSFLALILPSVIYTFPCGAPCRGTGQDEIQENSCWSRCFRASCPLNTGRVSLGLRRSWPVIFWLPVVMIKTRRSLFILPSHCFWVGVERWNLIAWVFLMKLNFVLKAVVPRIVETAFTTLRM